jgi:hypothetical protein
MAADHFLGFGERPVDYRGLATADPCLRAFASRPEYVRVDRRAAGTRQLVVELVQYGDALTRRLGGVFIDWAYRTESHDPVSLSFSALVREFEISSTRSARKLRRAKDWYQSQFTWCRSDQSVLIRLSIGHDAVRL